MSFPRIGRLITSTQDVSVSFQDAATHSYSDNFTCLTEDITFAPLRFDDVAANFGFTKTGHLPCTKNTHTHTDSNSNYGLGISAPNPVLLVAHMQSSGASRVWQSVAVSHSPTKFTDFLHYSWCAAVGPPDTESLSEFSTCTKNSGRTPGNASLVPLCRLQRAEYTHWRRDYFHLNIYKTHSFVVVFLHHDERVWESVYVSVNGREGVREWRMKWMKTSGCSGYCWM